MENTRRCEDIVKAVMRGKFIAFNILGILEKKDLKSMIKVSTLGN
jgi:hypothetical protein